MGTLHCLSVGCGDASVIKTGEMTFLVDCHQIEDYSCLLPYRIEGVFITHQHKDHYAGLKYLKDNEYSIGYLIYSPYERRHADNSVTLEEWREFASLVRHFELKGTQTLTPYRQADIATPYWAPTYNLTFRILGPSQSIATCQTRELHDACLVIHAHMGNRSCLFTGDASDTNLEDICDVTNNYCMDILHASHHGSIHGASLPFIEKGKPRYTLISTKSGKHENIPHPNALRRYRTHTQGRVIRTDIDGTWKWEF